MSTLLNCPHCSQQMHSSAPACPKCGAPAQHTGNAAPYTSYSQVPWFRKRWFAILSILVFSPIFLVIAFTGNVYFEKNGQLHTIPKNAKFVVLGISILLVLINNFGK